MTRRKLVARSLRFYWRTHLAVLAGAAVGSAVLTGALAVGDSVRGSLKDMALRRLGEVSLACAPQDRFFRADLADEVGQALGAPSAPVLVLRGSVAVGDGSARVNRVNVHGVDERFWRLGSTGVQPVSSGSAGVKPVLLSPPLAARLGAKPSDELLIRVEKPGRLSREAPLSREDDSTVAFRLPFAGVVPAGRMGLFGLQANQRAALNAFVPLDFLARAVGLESRANMLLLAGKQGLTPAAADRALRQSWRLADGELELRELPDSGVVELRSPRVFLEEPVIRAVDRLAPDAVGVLTYFAASLRAHGRETPYSIISAVGPLSSPTASAQAAPPRAGPALPPGMTDDQVVINSWLADDLQAEPGDSLEVSYFVLGPRRQLRQRSRTFRVHSVVPLAGPWADPDLMPDFPGLADVESCRDWKPGVEIDLKKIRKQDEDYWNDHRGTPKAFITLAAGQKLWANRFGDLTAVRWPRRIQGSPVLLMIEAGLPYELDVASLGLFFRPVRQQALAAATAATDFGQLFLGLSCFLIISALLLVGLLFAFGIQQRTGEVGTLLALGFTRSTVRGLLLAEGEVLALAGAVVGTAGGVIYTHGVLWGLKTLWPQAVAGAAVEYHAAPLTLALGAAAAMLAELAAIWLALRGQTRRPARELLAGGADWGPGPRLGRWKLPVMAGLVLLASALALVLVSAGMQTAATEVFFSAGALLLVAGLALAGGLLSRQAAVAGKRPLTLGELAGRNAARRRGRSLTVMALLACGSFLIVSVGAFRQAGPSDPYDRASGTGGFAFLGETSLPVFSEQLWHGQDARATTPHGQVARAAVLPLRVHAGDDASCLNLNRAQAPRLLGVRAEELAGRGAFSFVKTAGAPPAGGPWLRLDQPQPDGAVPAIGDEPTLAWALHKSVGDTLPYTDERGRTFQIRIVGMISSSILQGALVISERDFMAKFPSDGGYRMFLVDCPPESADEAARELSVALRPVGLDLTPTAEILAQFSSVENAYLSVFQLLGGLGMVLGGVALGLVVMRNVLQRRGELALLRAVGYTRRRLVGLVFREHWQLLFGGLACGVSSALVAVAPALREGAGFPFVSVGLTLLAILASGAVWIYFATRLALAGPLLAALRSE